MSNVLERTGIKITKSNKISRWTQRKVKGGIVLSKQFFGIEAVALYPEMEQVNKFSGLSENAARLYLLMLFRASFKKNHQWVGPKDARKMIGLTKQEYTNAVEELDSKQFTVSAPCSNVDKHKYCRNILSFPYYDQTTDSYCVNTEPRTTTYSRTDTRFIKIPSILFSEQDNWLHKDKGLSITAIKVLLKLYEHNYLEQYGGVNPLMLNRDMNTGQFKINPILFDDIGLTESKFIKSLQGLINKGLVQVVHSIHEEYHLMSEKIWRYVCDESLRGNIILSNNSVQVITFRPNYQYKEELKGWVQHIQTMGGDVNDAIQHINS